jgi:ribose transport system substrate-binding protein
MKTKSVGTTKGVFTSALAGALCLGVAACASGSSSTTASGASTSTASSGSSSVVWTTAPSGYVAAGGTKLPGSYPTPTKGPGKGCRIGYVDPSGAIPGIQAEIQGIANVAAKFGCTVVSKDGQLNPQVQVTGMQSLLSEGVAAIIVNPLVVQALAAPITEANQKHIPVIIEDSPASPTGTNVAGTVSDYLQSRDVTAYAAAKAIADAKPGAQVGLLYPAFQAGNLQYQVQRFQYWAEKLGLHVAGTGDSSGDTPGADSQATSSLLQKHRNIQAIMTFNDTAAESASAAARSLGMNNVLVTGIDGESGVTGLISQGQVLMTWAYNNTQNGEEEGTAAIDAADGVKIPTKVTAPGAIIDKSNVSSYRPQA